MRNGESSAGGGQERANNEALGFWRGVWHVCSKDLGLMELRGPNIGKSSVRGGGGGASDKKVIGFWRGFGQAFRNDWVSFGGK
jgi:hypothetical protein